MDGGVSDKKVTTHKMKKKKCDVPTKLGKQICKLRLLSLWTA